MKTKLTPTELIFAIKLQILIENSADISTFTKLGYLTGYSSAGAKTIIAKLKTKEIIKVITVLGRRGSTTFEMLVNPITLINA
jgi:hypothetical protein